MQHAIVSAQARRVIHRAFSSRQPAKGPRRGRALLFKRPCDGGFLRHQPRRGNFVEYEKLDEGVTTIEAIMLSKVVLDEMGGKGGLEGGAAGHARRGPGAAQKLAAARRSLPSPPPSSSRSSSPRTQNALLIDRHDPARAL